MTPTTTIQRRPPPPDNARTPARLRDYRLDTIHPPPEARDLVTRAASLMIDLQLVVRDLVALIERNRPTEPEVDPRAYAAACRYLFDREGEVDHAAR